MKMRKLFLVILTIIPMGIFAQEIRYVTVPTSQDATPVPTTTAPVTAPVIQQQSEVAPTADSGEIYRDTLKNSERKAIHTTFFKNRFRDNWYISVGGGIGILMSEQSRYVNALDIAQPTIAFSVGKWVNPVVGVRFNATAAKLQGFSVWKTPTDAPHWGHGDWYVGKYTDPFEQELGRNSTNTYLDASAGQWFEQLKKNGDMTEIQIATDIGRYIEDTFLEMDKPRSTSKGDGYDYFITYAAGTVDLMLNITNLFDRYKPNRFFNLNGFIGAGYAHTFQKERWLDKVYTEDGTTITRYGEANANGQVKRTQSAVNSVMGKIGLEMTFRLSKQMTFNIEPHFLVLQEVFDRRVGDGNTMDMVFNGLAGLTYRFKDRNFYEPKVSAPEIVYVKQEVNKAMENQNDDIADRLKRIEDLLLNQPKTPAYAIEKELEHLKVIVHFVIDKWAVRQSEMYKLDEIAKFMAKYPMVHVSVSGYADVQTAYPAYNMKLSERRANEVARILTTKYGIDKNRLKINHFGDTVQPFNVNELNRAVIAFDIPEN